MSLRWQLSKELLNQTAVSASLLGEIVNPTQAYTMGMVHELVDADVLLERAIENAEQTPDDCLPQYAFTKRACQAAALRAIAEPADQLDAETAHRNDQ